MEVSGLDPTFKTMLSALTDPFALNPTRGYLERDSWKLLAR